VTWKRFKVKLKLLMSKLKRRKKLLLSFISKPMTLENSLTSRNVVSLSSTVKNLQLLSRYYNKISRFTN
jgi:hypothetical protein